MSLFVLLALAAAAQTGDPWMTVPLSGGATAEVASVDRHADKIRSAQDLIGRKEPAAAIAVLDPILAAFDAQKSNFELRFCARSMTETVYYSGLAATLKRSAVVLHQAACEAHFLKAFALIDLGRADEAKTFLDRAIELAPSNSQYLAERGEWFKSRKDWANSLADFEKAIAASEFSPEDRQIPEKARALRGVGFVKIELADLDAAETAFKESLKLEPNSAMAKAELEYIGSLRKK